MPSETSEVERYSYDELKKAQAYCAENAVLAALRACGQTSDAQKEVFRAHVNDLCASVFAGALRQYNPTTKEVVEPVDHSMVARVAELEKQLKEKEATVNALRASVPQRAAQITQQKIEVERKRTAQVLGDMESVEVSDEGEQLKHVEAKFERIKETFNKTSNSIVAATTKLDRVMSQTTETIDIVERAMKRPKTAIDTAMEKSPAKIVVDSNKTSANDVTNNAPAIVGTLRSRLALELCTAKSA